MMKTLVDGRRYSSNDLIGYERELNLQQIAAIAVEESLEDQNTEESLPPDPDWFAQWRNRAQDVSNEDMQRLWARVLKGEVCKAGSFSIHTLEFLSRMSRRDAALIEKLAAFAINGNNVASQAQDILLANGIRFIDLVHLEDLSLINGVVGLGVTLTLPAVIDSNGKNFFALGCGKKVLLMYPKDITKKSLEFEVYTLSHITVELLKLASIHIDLEYLKYIADSKKSECSVIYIGDACLAPEGKSAAGNLSVLFDARTAVG